QASSGALARFTPSNPAQAALLGVVFGMADATAAVDVMAGAAITASRLDVAALNDAVLDVPVIAGETADVPVAAAAGIGLARADSWAVVRRGASLTVTDQISIRAANTGDSSVTGQVQAGQGAGLGVAAAVLVAETAAVADLSADAGPGGGSARPDVTVAALDTITRNVVQATSSAPSSSSGTTPGAGTPAAGAQSFITGLLNARSSGADGRKAVTLDPRSGASGGQPGGQPG